MRARGILAVTILVAVALVGLAGCSKKLRPIQNLPPDTYVFVQGPVDAVSHRVHLYWYGTDPDGSVVGFAFRWVYPPPAPQNVKWDTILCDTTARCTDATFTVLTGDSGQVTPRFEIFAIDNQGLADPTPAVERFLLTNIAPLVQITNPLGSRDSTYASATLSWQTTDPDGGGPGLHYRIWLDGNEAHPDSTTNQTFTVPSARFLQNGTYQSGPRTLSVQAVDDGGRSGPPATMTWFVRAPAAVLQNNQGQLLVIDDVPSARANNALFDAFYKSIADLLTPAGTYDVLRPQFNPNIFRSASDLTQTFRQFKAVLWYRGGETKISPLITAYQDGIGAYLDGGGNLYLDGVYLVAGLNTPGAFGEDFVSRHLGSTRLIHCYAQIGTAGLVDSTAGWTCHNGSVFRSSVYGASGESYVALAAPPAIQDSTGGVRGFAVTDTNFVALWAMDSQLDPANVGFEVPVGVTLRQGGTGRIVLMSLPIRYGTPAVATNLMRRILHDFGLSIPLP
jgi:hypothetical protein